MMEQLELVCGGANTRPKQTKTMRRQAAAQLVEHLIRCGDLDATDTDNSVEDIMKATRSGKTDGYSLARKLEQDRYWECDLHLAEQLDLFDGILDEIYAKAEKQWDKDNPRPPASVNGDRVDWQGTPATVQGMYANRPQCYKIRLDFLPNPAAFYVVPFEEVASMAISETKPMRT